jgi:hypothetical protein
MIKKGIMLTCFVSVRERKRGGMVLRSDDINFIFFLVKRWPNRILENDSGLSIGQLYLPFVPCSRWRRKKRFLEEEESDAESKKLTQNRKIQLASGPYQLMKWLNQGTHLTGKSRPKTSTSLLHYPPNRRKLLKWKEHIM